MLKKSLIVLAIFCLILFSSSYIFAANMMQGAENVLNGAKNGVEDMARGVGNAANDAKDGVEDMMNNNRNDANNHNNDSMQSYNSEMTTNGNYSASRTATTSVGTNSANTFLWVIVAILTIAIVALVWYYGNQVESSDNR